MTTPCLRAKVRAMNVSCAQCSKVIPLSKCFACEWCLDRYACSPTCWAAVSIKHAPRCHGRGIFVARELGLQPTYDYDGKKIDVIITTPATNIPIPVEIGTECGEGDSDVGSRHGSRGGGLKGARIHVAKGSRSRSPTRHTHPKNITGTKARKILKDKTIRGHPITERQRRLFGWIAGGRK